MILDRVFPKQRLAYSKKIADDRKWAKQMVDHLIINYVSDTNAVNNSTSEYERKLSNYQLYNNVLNQKDFERECNPLGIEVGQFKDEIQPYNKTYNKIQTLLGEELARPLDYRTVLVNSDGIKSRQLQKDKLLKDFLIYEMEKTIAQTTNNPQAMDAEQQPPINPEEIDNYMQNSYLDAKEHTANQILQYLIRKLGVKDSMNDAFKHGLISGEECVWVGIENGEPTIEVLNSLGVFYHKSPEVKYVEDGLFAGYRTMMNTGDILDKFGDYLKQEDIEKLEGRLQGIHGLDGDLIGKKMKYPHTSVDDFHFGGYTKNNYDEGSYGQSTAEDWLVTHVEWRSQRKVGFIEYENDFGDITTDIVSEDFKVPEYATKSTKADRYGKKKVVHVFDDKTLEWTWIPEIWQGVRIGDKIYCCLGPKEYQYRSLDNPKKVKLGYHGFIYNNMNTNSVSLMDRMKPFQYLYFITSHRLKRLIARDKGKVFHFDTSMVPEKMGLEKVLYYLEEMDIDFYNPLQNAERPGTAQRGKITTATDRSNMQHILNYVQLLDAIDQQISDVAGIPRSREGQTKPYEAVQNVQQSLASSSAITEASYFYPHTKLWENVFNSLLQCAQECWREKSVIKQYVLDDLSLRTLDISDPSILNSDYGVFVSNLGKDTELFNTLKQLAQPLIQNDKAKFTDIIKLFKANSVPQLEKEIQASERRLQQEQLEQIQAQQESQQQAMQIQMQMKQAEFEHEKAIQAQKDAAAMEREIIKATSWGGDVNENNVPDVLEIEKFKHQSNVDSAKIELERDKMKHDATEKEKERKSKEKIARMSKNQPSSK